MDFIIEQVFFSFFCNSSPTCRGRRILAIYYVKCICKNVIFSHIGFGDCIHLSHRHTPFLYKRNRVSCPNIPFPQIFFFHTGNQITEWLKNCFPDMYIFKIAYLIVNVNSQDTQISCYKQGIFSFRIKYIIFILFDGTYKLFFFITLHL